MILLYTTLLTMGVHIGHCMSDSDYTSRSYIYGHRSKYAVIDLNRTVFLLRRALSFLFSSNLNYALNLFVYSIIHTFPVSVSKVFQDLVSSEVSKCVFSPWYWTGGSISNYKFCFGRFISILFTGLIRGFRNIRFFRRLRRLRYFRYLHKVPRRQLLFINGSAFQYLFVKLLYVSYITSLARHKLHKLHGFWRAIIFIRCYRHIFKRPDIVCAVAPHYGPLGVLNEFRGRGIPTISLVDTNMNRRFEDVTYPIPSNDDSILIALFFFSIFSNVIRTGTAHAYNMLYATPSS